MYMVGITQLYINYLTLKGYHVKPYTYAYVYATQLIIHSHLVCTI